MVFKLLTDNKADCASIRMRLITKMGFNLRISLRLTVLAVMAAVIVAAHKLEIAIKRSLALKSELFDFPRLGTPQL